VEAGNAKSWRFTVTSKRGAALHVPTADRVQTNDGLFGKRKRAALFGGWAGFRIMPAFLARNRGGFRGAFGSHSLAGRRPWSVGWRGVGALHHPAGASAGKMNGWKTGKQAPGKKKKTGRALPGDITTTPWGKSLTRIIC